MIRKREREREGEVEGEREGMSSVVGKKVERKKGGGAHEFVVECCVSVERAKCEK